MKPRSILRAALFLAAWAAFWSGVGILTGAAYQLGLRFHDLHW